MTYEKILAALDRSSHSDLVFEQALNLAQKEGAKLMLFHGIPLDQHQGLFLHEFELTTEPLARYASALQTELERQQTEIQQWLSDYCQNAKKLGITVESKVGFGEPGKVICDLARRWDADLIVLGRRGLTGMMEMLMGSVSSYVVHRAPCTVSIVQSKLNPASQDG
ncbi:MAG: universal stress protein [Cyanobacteriota bacterium]|nr:universal stress protein [Cyanobacteriota bacterium]